MTQGRTKNENPLNTSQCLVIKIGSALMIHPQTSQVYTERICQLAEDISTLKSEGKNVVLVVSGAVALGRSALNLKKTPLKLEEKQAAAAIGQPKLMKSFEMAFAPYSIPVAQALLSFDDTERRRRWLNARETFATLLIHGVIPVVNENDTVATEELRYGDNDRLAARVAQMIGADTLILLSDIDGLYERDPNKDPNARHIAKICKINPEIIAMATGANTRRSLGSGGMRTKVEAAQIAFSAGCRTVITDGQSQYPLRRLMRGGRASWFLPDMNPISARQNWLAGTLTAKGSLIIDQGAVKALKAGASLLPIGVTGASGPFERGDAVAIMSETDEIIGHGITAYSLEDARRILGKHSEDIVKTLGYEGRPALIHRDDLVLKH